MEKLLKTIVAGLMLFCFTTAEAQDSQVMYHMNLPQSHLLNPAFRPTSSIYVGLPALTGINFNLGNNFLAFGDLFTEGASVDESNIPFLSAGFNTDKFLSGLKDRNYLETKTGVQLLGVGFAAGKGNYFFLDIIERAEGNFVFPRDMIRLAFLGNADFAGQTFDFSSFRTDVQYFRETGIGFSKQVTERLRIGIKGKMYMGIAAVAVQNNSMKLTVNNDYTSTLTTDMRVNFCAPVNIITNAENLIDDISFDELDTSEDVLNFMTNTKNLGFGADLGAEFSLTNQIVLSAALTDFGYIKWKDKESLASLVTESDVTLNGMNISDVQDGNATFEDVAKEMLDSLRRGITVREPGNSFRTTMPMGITAGGKFILNDKISFGALSHSRIIGKQIREAFTLSANLNLRNFFSASLAYTASNHSYDNIGLGLGIRGGWAQFYLLADRIPLTWKNVMIDGDKFPMPANWNNVNLRFGINLLFGNRINKPEGEL